MNLTEAEKWYEGTFKKPLKSPLDFYRMGRKQYGDHAFDLAVQCLEHYLAHSSRVEVAPMHLLAHAHRALYSPQAVPSRYDDTTLPTEEDERQAKLRSKTNMVTKKEQEGDGKRGFYEASKSVKGGNGGVLDLREEGLVEMLEMVTPISTTALQDSKGDTGDGSAATATFVRCDTPLSVCIKHAERALECFVASVRLGFEADWQMIVETAIDIDTIETRQLAEEQQQAQQKPQQQQQQQRQAKDYSEKTVP